MKKAVIYLRISSDKQIDNTSLETQEERCREYCRQQGLNIIGIIKHEAVSAKGENFQRLDDLLRSCKEYKGRFEVLVVYKLDRFARSTLQHLLLREELKKLNVILRSTSENIDESSQGRCIETVMASFNQLDNDNRRERVKIAMYHRVDEGLWPWAPPVGYFRPKILGVRLGNCEWDPNCAKDIIRLFELYSTSSYTFSSLANLMAKRGISNYKGKRIKFSKQLIQRVLNNPFYIGILKVKDYPIHEGKHKPLISSSLWQKCQDLQNKKSNHAINHRLIENPDFPLRRFTLCGFCNHPLTACWTKGGSGGRYAYYYCVNKNCSKYGVMVKKGDLHDEFFDYLEITKPIKDYLPLFKVVFIGRYKERQNDFKSDFLRKEKEIEQLTQEKKEVAIKGAKGIYPDLTLKEMLSDYEQKILFSKNSLNEFHHEELDLDPMLDKGLQTIQTLEKSWYDAIPERKPKLQRLIYPTGVSYHYSGFSNSEINPCFALINEVAASSSTKVILIGIEPMFTG